VIGMVIPVHDVNPVRRTPWVTYVLIATNVLVFLLTPLATDTGVGSIGVAQLCRQEAFLDRYAAIPRELTDNQQLPVVPNGEVGTSDRGTGCVVGRPAYHKVPALSVLYAMFLHGGWLHLLGNMLFLWVFGNNVEDRLGRVRYLLFYLLCGYAATYGFAFADPNGTTTLVGASGAIAGVLGAYLVLFPRARVTSLVPFLLFLPARLPAWVVLGSWFVLQYFYAQGASIGAGAGVAYLAHVVGFIAGIILIILLGGLRKQGGPPPRSWEQWQSPYR
jgi:membrane associated rhomboid family serine protease